MTWESMFEDDDLAVPISVVRAWLKDNGYDGIYCADGDCACFIDDLFPCAEGVGPDCRPGYRATCSGCGEFDKCIVSDPSRQCWKKEGEDV